MQTFANWPQWDAIRANIKYEQSHGLLASATAKRITLMHRKARRPSGLPISVNWTFSPGVTAEALRAKIDWEDAQVSQETVPQGALLLAKSGRLKLGNNILRTLWSVFNHCDIIGLQSYRIRWKKTQNNGCYAAQGHSRSSRSVPIESPYAHWQARSGLHISVNWTFSLVVTAEVLWANICGDFAPTGDGWPKF